MPSKNIIGARVKEARQSKNPRLTQEALSSRLQVSGVHIDRTAIAKIESGDRAVTDIELLGIASALAVSSDWLLNV